MANAYNPAVLVTSLMNNVFVLPVILLVQAALEVHLNNVVDAMKVSCSPKPPAILVALMANISAKANAHHARVNALAALMVIHATAVPPDSSY